MADILKRLRTEVTIGSGQVTPLRVEAADEIERLREVLQAVEIMTATGEGLSPEAAIEVHIIAAEGRSDDPAAWRAKPEAIERLRAAIRSVQQE